MLADQDRQKLDGVVQQMTQNGESPDYIQSAVNDFKSKYDPDMGGNPGGEAPKSVGGFFGNVLSSGANFLGNIGEALIHPINTLQNLGTTAVGGLEKAGGQNNANTAQWDNFTNFIKQRYGSIDALKETMYKDPVGFAADVSTVLGGAGMALKGASLVGDVGEAGALAKTAGVLNKASEFTNPISLAGKGIEAATAGRTLAPFGKAVDTEGAAIAAERGVNLNAASLSKSPAVSIIEGATGKGFFGQPLADMVEAAGQKMNQIAEDTIQKTGQSPDLSIAGKIVLQGFNDARDVAYQTKDALYKEASLKDTNIPVNTEATRSIIRDEIEKEQMVLKNTGKESSPVLNYLVQQEKGLSSPTLTAEEAKLKLQAINKKVSNFNDPISTGNQAVLKRIGATLSDELDNSIKDWAIKNNRQDLVIAIDNANSHWRQMVKTFDSSYGNKITSFADQPDKIIPAIISPATSVEDIPRIYETVGDQAKAAIQSVFMAKMFRNIEGTSAGRAVGNLETEMAKYGPAKLKAILEPEQYNAMSDLAKLQGMLRRGARVAEGSQTAFIGRTVAELGSVAINPMFAIKAVLGDFIFSKFISSPSGQRFLTTGMQATGATGRAISGAGRVLTPITQLNNATNLSGQSSDISQSSESPVPVPQ